MGQIACSAFSVFAYNRTTDGSLSSGRIEDFSGVIIASQFE
jgi:hypothetical protein